MDHSTRIQEYYKDLRPPSNSSPSASSSIVYGIFAIYIVHQVLVYYDYPILSPQELLWNALVYVTPTRLVLNAAKRQELRANNMLSQTHAAKSEALRRMLGMGGGALTHRLAGGEGIMRRMSTSTGLATESSDAEPTADTPPGLGNWDNSCYQNSVLQGLSSLGALRSYLGSSSATLATGSTSGSLQETIGKLNNPANNGRQLWTPAKLKSMSSWQQQDAQEYFSKIMEELDKEAGQAQQAEQVQLGLETSVEHDFDQQAAGVTESNNQQKAIARNPMEGLIAQRVGCTQCGFSEGLSMIPFNCLTLPLGSEHKYDLDECLDQYTDLDEISDVECAKCTLLRAERQLQQMVPPAAEQEGSTDGASETPKHPALGLPPEIRVLAAKRLQAIQQALNEDDFSDNTLNETCQIPKRAHISSIKTRQALIGRAPQSLVVHINRSVFDELTGVQRKNYANVRYPMVLNLDDWVLGDGPISTLTGSMSSSKDSDQQYLYRLKAVVTHYGRHENGHYICYRKHPVRRARDPDSDDVDDESSVKEQWWRLSDEDVSAVSDADVLAQGGVFMLFYEREAAPPQPSVMNRLQAMATTAHEAVEPETDTATLVEAAGIVLSAEPPVQGIDSETSSAAAKAQLPQPEPDSLGAAPTIDQQAAAEPPPSESTAEEVSLDEPRLADDQLLADSQEEGVLADTLPLADDQPSTGTTTEDESEVADEAPATLPTPKPPTPLMRTARGRQSSRRESRGDGGFGGAFRAVAAT